MSFLVRKKIGRVMCLGMNRPEKKNTLNMAGVRELKTTLEVLEQDQTVSVLVLHGERGTFSHGYDSEEFKQNHKMIEEIEGTGLLEKYPLKPVVAAVSGHAVGFGFDLALWCDFRIVEETALMGGYARRFGMPASDVVVQRNISLLGLHKALDLMLTGRLLTAQEALQSGIATRVVACGSGLGQAVSFAQSLSNVPQASLRADRAALIALSGKYNSETNSLIVREKTEQRSAAIKEAEEGLHITASGDTRQKLSGT